MEGLAVGKCDHVGLGVRRLLKCRQGQFGTHAHAGGNAVRMTFTIASRADRHYGDCYARRRHTGTVALPAGISINWGDVPAWLSVAIATVGGAVALTQLRQGKGAPAGA